MEKVDTMRELLARHYGQSHFVEKCAVESGSALYAAISAPIHTLCAALEACLDTGKHALEGVKDVMDGLDTSYRVGRNAAVSALESSPVPAPEPRLANDREAKARLDELPWWKRALARTCGVFHVIVDLPLHLISRAVQTFCFGVKQVVAIPFKVAGETRRTWALTRQRLIYHFNKDKIGELLEELDKEPEAALLSFAKESGLDLVDSGRLLTALGAKHVTDQSQIRAGTPAESVPGAKSNAPSIKTLPEAAPETSPEEVLKALKSVLPEKTFMRLMKEIALAASMAAPAPA
jgi:hypothetical protein